MKAECFAVLIMLQNTKYLIQLINFFWNIFGLLLVNFCISEHKMDDIKQFVDFV